MDQGTLSERKTLFFQKVSLRSSEVLAFDSVLVCSEKEPLCTSKFKYYFSRVYLFIYFRFLNLIIVDTVFYSFQM